MDPSTLTAPNMLPTATSWYMNPYFMASFGAVVALGFVLFFLAYFVFIKLKIFQPEVAKIPIEEDAKCKTCGLTVDMIAKLGLPCATHAAVIARVDAIDKWIEGHGDDYKELRRRVDAIERNRSRNP